ncbi:MAG: asparaginase [Epsilonproteobacteria bacterium]|nr:MAG: asparaginase [Campylobacterota bacterium]
MNNILLISTGGTFNKAYHATNGELKVDTQSQALQDIASKWFYKFNIINIIGKDSLDITSQDRAKLLETINQASSTHIIVIHGTDTMDATATYLANAGIKKCIILTGAMLPYSIDPVEATANLCAAFGYLNAMKEDGVYISMHGIIAKHTELKKDKKLGKFINYGYLP